MRAMNRKIRRALAVVVLLVPLAGAPNVARAQDITDFLSMAVHALRWVAEAALYAAKAEAWISEKFGGYVQAAMPEALASLHANIKSGLVQGKIDAKTNAVKAKAAGDAGADSLVSIETRVCAVTHADQEASVAAAVTDQAVTGLSGISAGRGGGTNADTNSPAYTAVEVNDLCKLGFLDATGTGRYGELPKNMKCTDLTTVDPSYVRYIDADMRLSSVIGKLQYPLPNINHVNVNTPDGHMNFVSATGTAVTATETAPGLGSELDFAAAYKFCEHLQPTMATPTHNSGTPTPNDVASIRQDRNDVALRTAASEECVRALAYRTSCPASSTTSLQSTGGANCHEAQVQLCARLTSSHKQGGLELSMKGDDPLFSAALTNCATEGMSQAMYDAIMAHRCHDRNYAFKVLPTIVGTGAALERAISFDCPKLEAAYDKNMEDERDRFNLFIHNLILLRSTPAVSNASAGRVAN